MVEAFQKLMIQLFLSYKIHDLKKVNNINYKIIDCP